MNFPSLHGKVKLDQVKVKIHMAGHLAGRSLPHYLLMPSPTVSLVCRAGRVTATLNSPTLPSAFFPILYTWT